MSRHELSRALLTGDKLAPARLNGRYLDPAAGASCPLGAAFLGTLHGPADVQRFYGLLKNSSYESATAFILHGLMKAFPILGLDVRAYPPLHKQLRADCPKVLDNGTYPTLNHAGPDGTLLGVWHLRRPRSIYAAIAQLNDRYDWPKDKIAGMLARVGL